MRQRFLTVFSMESGSPRSVAGVLPHEVGAGGPDRHRQLDLGVAAGGDQRLDLDVVGLGSGETQGIGDRFWHAGSMQASAVERQREDQGGCLF